MPPRRASSPPAAAVRSDASTSDRRLIQSVDRSARLLRAIATSRHPVSVAELAAACELNRSTTWRLLTTLEHHGLVERDDVSQRYAIGYGLVRLAAGKTDHAILIRTARPVLERIAAETSETVNLSIALSSGMVVSVDQVDAVPLVSVNWLGRLLPWHCTSAGRLQLAYLPPAEVDAYLAETRLEAFTPRTIVSADKLRADIVQTRKRGYSLVLEEQEIGLNAVSSQSV